ncbi:unnamed protein product [Ambrosiozyma monospora]|uniref:Unnamed protein product n=1 Tax=Ambrosiozyma monospora TaxID=43982 RepID=A0A9W6T9H3_AMBMO|nr:unnamed protein product [Ambrosiozyma monospora]
MTKITQRSLYYIQSASHQEQVFKDITQTEKAVIIPANSSLPLSLLEKINLPYDQIKSEKLYNLFQKIQLMDIKFNGKIENGRTNLNQTIFNDFQNGNQAGLNIQVAPQGVASLEEYHTVSKEFIETTLKTLRINPIKEPLFFRKEWYKYHSFDISQFESNDDIVEVSLLRLWLSLTVQELPIHLSNLKTLSSYEFMNLH